VVLDRVLERNVHAGFDPLTDLPVSLRRDVGDHPGVVCPPQIPFQNVGHERLLAFGPPARDDGVVVLGGVGAFEFQGDDTDRGGHRDGVGAVLDRLVKPGVAP